MKKILVFICAAFVLGLVAPSTVLAQEKDNGKWIKSLIFPGMGQLSDGQVIEGLGFMTGETVLLTLTVSQISMYFASVRATQYDSVNYYRADSYYEKKQIFDSWNTSFKNANNAQMYGFVFGGLAVGVWAGSVVHAMLVQPAAKSDDAEGSFLDIPLNGKPVVFMDGKTTSVAWVMNF